MIVQRCVKFDRCAGNRTSRTNALNSAFSETYQYDLLDRLTDTNRGGSDYQAWGLDGLGNFGAFTDASGPVKFPVSTPSGDLR